MAKSRVIFRNRSTKDTRPSRKPILKKLNEFTEVLILLNSAEGTQKNAWTALFPTAKTTFIYQRKEKKNESESLDATFHKSDFNLTGSLKNEKLTKITAISFDLVVDLTEENKLSKFLLSSLNQSFMIGRRGNSKSFLYDLLLNDSLSDTEIITEFRTLITLLNQHGNK